MSIWQRKNLIEITHKLRNNFKRCYNMPGAYRCVCIEGYEGTGDKDGGDCVNIDECARGMHDCHLNSEVR